MATGLVEAGARLIAANEPLSTRRLATEVGVSTSRVYTHFGSMEELRRAIRRIGFERLAEAVKDEPDLGDPVAVLCWAGWAYCRNAEENPHMYRVMFMERPLDDADAEVGIYTFQMLVDQIQRCIDAGRFKDDGAWDMATQLWTSIHGAVVLQLAGIMDADTVDAITTKVGRALFVSFGDDGEKADASLAQAVEWVERHPKGADAPGS